MGQWTWLRALSAAIAVVIGLQSAPAAASDPPTSASPAESPSPGVVPEQQWSPTASDPDAPRHRLVRPGRVALGGSLLFVGAVLAASGAAIVDASPADDDYDYDDDGYYYRDDYGDDQGIAALFGILITIHATAALTVGGTMVATGVGDGAEDRYRTGGRDTALGFGAPLVAGATGVTAGLISAAARDGGSPFRYGAGKIAGGVALGALAIGIPLTIHGARGAPASRVRPSLDVSWQQDQRVVVGLTFTPR